ncbi:MAG: VOC family protein [Bacteriovoracaceae bacterium]|nr:VOC family protein [Bacteriovoracaceae bacterium]
MSNLGTYFEIPVNDMDRAIKFYSHVFNVEFTKEVIHGCEMAFFPFTEQGQGISGSLAKGEIYRPSVYGSLIYLSTESIDKTMAKAKEVGGEELFLKTSVPNLEFSAEFKDSEGNRVALFESI